MRTGISARDTVYCSEYELYGRREFFTCVASGCYDHGEPIARTSSDEKILTCDGPRKTERVIDVVVHRDWYTRGSTFVWGPMALHWKSGTVLRLVTVFSILGATVNYL